MKRLNFCRALYPRQVNEAVFSFLDTHDTPRARESCKNRDVLLQKLTLLLTMAGTPCLYYGTEIAMRGKRTPYNRATMPWDEIDAGKHDRFKAQVAALLHVRNTQPALKRDEMEFLFDPAHPRLIRFRKGELLVTLNAGETQVPIPGAGEILFQNRLQDGVLKQDGALIEKAP